MKYGALQQSLTFYLESVLHRKHWSIASYEVAGVWRCRDWSHFPCISPQICSCYICTYHSCWKSKWICKNVKLISGYLILARATRKMWKDKMLKNIIEKKLEIIWNMHDNLFERTDLLNYKYWDWKRKKKEIWIIVFFQILCSFKHCKNVKYISLYLQVQKSIKGGINGNKI